MGMEVRDSLLSPFEFEGLVKKGIAGKARDRAALPAHRSREKPPFKLWVETSTRA
jgi:hypothetical protein